MLIFPVNGQPERAHARNWGGSDTWGSAVCSLERRLLRDVTQCCQPMAAPARNHRHRAPATHYDACAHLTQPPMCALNRMCAGFSQGSISPRAPLPQPERESERALLSAACICNRCAAAKRAPRGSCWDHHAGIIMLPWREDQTSSWRRAQPCMLPWAPPHPSLPQAPGRQLQGGPRKLGCGAGAAS